MEDQSIDERRRDAVRAIVLLSLISTAARYRETDQRFVLTATTDKLLTDLRMAWDLQYRLAFPVWRQFCVTNDPSHEAKRLSEDLAMRQRVGGHVLIASGANGRSR